MALSKKPNDYLTSELLAKQTERNCDLESLLWDFARRNYSALDAKIVESFTNRIDELRFKIVEAYRSRTFDKRTFDVMVGPKGLIFDWSFLRTSLIMSRQPSLNQTSYQVSTSNRTWVTKLDPILLDQTERLGLQGRLSLLSFLCQLFSKKISV